MKVNEFHNLAKSCMTDDLWLECELVYIVTATQGYCFIQTQEPSISLPEFNLLQ